MWNPLASLPPSNALAPYAATMVPPGQPMPVPPGRGGGAPPLNPIYGGGRGGGGQVPPMPGWGGAMPVPPAGWNPAQGMPPGMVPGGPYTLPTGEVRTQVVGAPPAPDGGVSATGAMGDPNSFRAAIQAWRAQRPALPDIQALLANWDRSQPFDQSGFMDAINAWRGELTDWRGQRPTRSGF